LLIRGAGGWGGHLRQRSEDNSTIKYCRAWDQLPKTLSR
jgi:hypothetical protein